MLHFRVESGGALRGHLRVPGDKSLSHRAIMLGSLAEGSSQVEGFLDGADCLATLNAFRAMGVTIEGPAQGRLIIHGVGLHGLQAPTESLDMGNSGTAMRLLAGVLAGQRFDSVLLGDASLNRRPMKRIIEPLSLMGAQIEATDSATAPLHIHGGQRLTGISYRMPIASAQVKSCILLAGLYAQGRTAVTEPAPTRDHTERLLKGFGYPVEKQGDDVMLTGGGRLQACAIDIPADISSAAFFMVGASIAPHSDLLLEHVGINPTRTGIIQILQRMGADITLSNERLSGGEPVADIRVKSAALHGIEIPPEWVPLAIDEFPAVFIAAACAQGETVLTGAEELRLKESDRIAVMAEGLQTLGIVAQPTADGMRIQGGQLTGGTVDSHTDHRIAMAFAIAALRSNGPIHILDCTNVNTSFPGFAELARGVGLMLQEQVE
ncbi:MAG: 3-phosphoshikimate 1-carboxyvinyltransferase [Candidatus Competibacteraceae bacterium]|jgi:3-phosphoshikimate 1-carboxyvinyltransferase|nr:3-phosphoshikimate 1-carboxyvinyltransferase [Candidatus Competibacteraceae bacterium]